MRTHLTAVAIFCVALVQAQEVIGTSGSHYVGSQVQLSVNIGEPVISTAEGNTRTLTQGFEQPWADVSTSLPTSSEEAASITVYPNPTRHELFIALGRTAHGEQYSLFDAAGKLVVSGRIEADIQTIGMERIASGTYQLVLHTQEGSPLGAFRIIVNH